MPRVSRELSKTGIYHVMLRGNERKKIFLSNENRIRFIDILAKKSKETEFSVLAYCLMDNHIHLIIKEESDRISRIMKRISVSYVYYFNKKYDRIGHLFQDRFKSEPINDEKYLLAVIRYIHNNPVKALMVQEQGLYRWSSYNAYISKDKADSGIIDRDFILRMFSDSKEQAIKQFIEFSKQQANEEIMDIKEMEGEEKKGKINNEDEVMEYISGILKRGQSCSNELMKNRELRNEIICYLKENSTLSTRKIAAILGIGRNIVQRVK